MSSVQNEDPQCKSKDSRTFKSSLIQVNQYKEKKRKDGMGSVPYQDKEY